MECHMQIPVIKLQWTVVDSIIVSSGAFYNMSVMRSPLPPLVQPLISKIVLMTKTRKFKQVSSFLKIDKY